MHGSYLGFVDSADVMCRVGTISGVYASHVSTDEISCLMPAHAPGNVPVEITLNRFDHTFNEAAYHYEPMISTLGPIPTRVLAEGGGEITLSLWPSEDTDMSLVCIVDTFPVPASKLSAGTFLCIYLELLALWRSTWRLKTQTFCPASHCAGISGDTNSHRVESYDRN